MNIYNYLHDDMKKEVISRLLYLAYLIVCQIGAIMLLALSPQHAFIINMLFLIILFILMFTTMVYVWALIYDNKLFNIINVYLVDLVGHATLCSLTIVYYIVYNNCYNVSEFIYITFFAIIYYTTFLVYILYNMFSCCCTSLTDTLSTKDVNYGAIPTN